MSKTEIAVQVSLWLTIIFGSWFAWKNLEPTREVKLCEEAMYRSGEHNHRFYVPHLGRKFCEKEGWRKRISQGSQIELEKLEAEGAFAE